MRVSVTTECLHWRRRMSERRCPSLLPAGALALLLLFLSLAGVRSQETEPTNVAASAGEGTYSSEAGEVVVEESVPSESGYKRLAKAAHKCNLVAIRGLLDSNLIHPNGVVDEKGHSPLTAAAAKGCTEGVKELLAHGADVNHTVGVLGPFFGFNSLLLAARKGHVEVVRLLLNSTTTDKDAVVPGKFAPTGLGMYAGHAAIHLAGKFNT